MKYTTVKVGIIITQIALKTDVEDYTEGILEIFFPYSENWSKKEAKQWIAENNKRMTAICNFLNESMQ